MHRVDNIVEITASSDMNDPLFANDDLDFAFNPQQDEIQRLSEIDKYISLLSALILPIRKLMLLSPSLLSELEPNRFVDHDNKSVISRSFYWSSPTVASSSCRGLHLHH